MTGHLPGGDVDERIVQPYRRAEDRTTQVRTSAEDVYAVDAAVPVIALPDARTARQPATA